MGESTTSIAHLHDAALNRVAEQMTLPPELVGRMADAFCAAAEAAMPPLTKFMKQTVETLTSVVTSDFFQQLALASGDHQMVAAGVTAKVPPEWADGLDEGYRSGDSLPWKVFADWCDEERPDLAKSVRFVAGHLEGVSHD